MDLDILMVRIAEIDKELETLKLERRVLEIKLALLTGGRVSFTSATCKWCGHRWRGWIQLHITEAGEPLCEECYERGTPLSLNDEQKLILEWLEQEPLTAEEMRKRFGEKQFERIGLDKLEALRLIKCDDEDYKWRKETTEGERR